jgi:hypothetical protein
VSEIDFDEIEKAMAELVSKAQGKQRHQGLSQVATERAQIAKKTETAQEQGDIATKRIIVASNKIRSNPRPAPKPTSQPINPNPTRVMDFVVPVYSGQPSNAQKEQPIENKIDTDSELQKTVGELSNQYLVGQVGQDNEVDLALETKEDIEQEIEESLKPQPELGIDDEQSQEDPPRGTSLEELTGPSPVMSSVQEPIISIQDNKDYLPNEDSLPEVDSLAQDVGRVHKIYGQKLPKEYLKKNKTKHQSHTLTKTKVIKPKSKKGFAFYFVMLMIFASLAVWSFAAYLYFAS